MLESANHKKFEEMLVYLANGCADHRFRGDVKFNKLLYYADSTAYRKLGHTISGTRYNHGEHGPISASLLPARNKLIDQGDVTVEEEPLYDHVQVVTVAKREPDPDVLSDDERGILDEVLDRFRDSSGNEAEDESHREPAYKLTSMGDPIPIELSLLSPEPSAETMRRAEARIAEHGW